MDVRAELEQFEWENAEWTDDKLLAASPFRYDRKPSFYVWLRDNPSSHAKAGYWADLGHYDQSYARGGITKLLAYLRHETEEETDEYLHEKYGTDLVNDFTDDDRWHIAAPRLHSIYHPRALPESKLPSGPSTIHPYLTRRGISIATQQLFDIRYDTDSQAIAIPWRLPSGNLANVKYRKVYGKAFWYEKGAWPIRDLIFGIDVVYRQRPKVCAILEAEIDAMSVVESGYSAVATGGVAFGREKLDVLLRAPIDEYVILSDNDKAGDKLRELLIEGLSRRKRVKLARVDARWKDANEALINGGTKAIDDALRNALYVK
jgi:5S rRNA maturation endonuclease (ribonuclease M5)